MKQFIVTILFAFQLCVVYSQTGKQGIVITQKFLAPSIQNNKGGEDPMRQVSIYLPPGYNETKERYPTIYFLHGYSSTDTEMMEWLGFKSLMDSAVKSGKMRPMILVVPNSDTKYRGSFYTNSTLTGNWADFIGKDVVQYVDKNYRTIANRNSRGLFGHSMGGTGALKMAMLYADVFSAVYAMSPGGMHFSNEFHLNNMGLKNLTQIQNMDSLLKKATPETSREDFPFFELLFADLARTYSPDESMGQLQAALPVHYEGKKMVVDPVVLKKWEANFPINMIEDHIPALKSLTALKMDWGRNDDFPHIPATNLEFSKKLEALGIKHFAEEYIGDHVNMLDGYEGRIFTEVFPFFEKYLK